MRQDDQREFNILGDIDIRKGTYANLAFIMSQESEDIIDFVLTDGIDSDGRVTGLVTSRVIMSRKTLIELRDAITRHIATLEGD